MSATVPIGSMNASKKIFERFLRRILSSPLSFFDTTPFGRIMNRVGKDVDALDNELPFILLECVRGSFEV